MFLKPFSDVVMDNFNGTGTTLMACSSRRIKSIGIELSKAQCEYTEHRLNNIQFSLDMFFDDNSVFERQQGKVVIQNAEHIVNIERIEVFNA